MKETISRVRFYVDKELIKVLPTKEQFSLARQALAGQEEFHKKARERLVLSMTRRIIQKATKQYNIRRFQLEDVLQEAYVVLSQIFSPQTDNKHGIKARFDPALGIKPITYADYWIDFAIQKFFERSETIRLPRGLAYQVAQFKAFLAEEEDPTEEQITELIRKLDVSRQCLEAALASQTTKSLDEPVYQDEPITLLDMVTSDEELDPLKEVLKEEKRALIREAIEEALDERERKIVKLHFGIDCGEPQSFRKIANKFSLTNSRVGQISKEASRKLKDWFLNHPTYGPKVRELLN